LVVSSIQPERVAGVSGNDEIFAADGSLDNIDCGSGSNDTVYFDADLDNIVGGVQEPASPVASHARWCTAVPKGQGLCLALLLALIRRSGW
jgi:hypothetical protein